MAAVKSKVGRMPCPCCGHGVMLKENEAGTLTIACDECDVNMWAKRGTAAAASWRAKVPGKVPEPAAPAPATPAAAAVPSKVPSTVPSKVPSKPAGTPPVPQPVPRKPAKPFDMLGL